MEDNKIIVVKFQKGDSDSKDTVANIDFCADCVSITIDGRSIHIDWSEVVSWPQWLSENIEK